MNKFKSISIKHFLLTAAAVLTLSCDDDTATSSDILSEGTQYFIGIEAATDPAVEILSTAESLSEGLISPVGNGFEQPAWMSYYQLKNQIITTGYTSAPEFISYSIVDEVLTKGESFFTDMAIFASEVVDENTMLLMGAPREGLGTKKIYVIDTQSMSISDSKVIDFGNDVENDMAAFPNDMKVRGDKLFVAYFMKMADAFATPMANQARVAVFSYPGLEFEKIITDDRAPNIGRYYTNSALEIAENGDIYTYSPSSLACGYNPVPETNSGILRIKNGETEFDPTYHIDFETLSGGYKINDLYYIGFAEKLTELTYLNFRFRHNSKYYISLRNILF
ncbi:MAG: DUF4374 domain-containing protein [Flavobacteriaceae bacterium]|nr:DUF4374 domain-containing protein [Flavobacteriaceae bacterium]